MFMPMNACEAKTRRSLSINELSENVDFADEKAGLV
jgi:hypothetical protein